MTAAHAFEAGSGVSHHRTALRQQIERAIEAALDVAARLIARLDAMDGDADFEADADREADAGFEPACAAAASHGSQIRWAGHDDMADRVPLSCGGPA